MSFASIGSSNKEEINKETVRQLWEEVNSGNLALMDEHPGLAEIVPTVTTSQQVMADSGYQIQELLADGDWVMMREILWGTPSQDFMGAKAGERSHMEAIGMYRVQDGKIVKQHAQMGPHEHPHPDEPGTNVPKRAGTAQKEANKALVRSVLTKMSADNLEALDAHPGMHALKPMLAQAQAGLSDRTFELKELLADGDWVVARMVLGGTVRSDWMGAKAGDASRMEAIGMYRIADGKIVRQHSQMGPYAG